jgi:hypothetical protein
MSFDFVTFGRLARAQVLGIKSRESLGCGEAPASEPVGTEVAHTGSSPPMSTFSSNESLTLLMIDVQDS